MSVTIKDIADLCGVSVGTVDRAVNGRPGINFATKQRILEAKELLHYKPHRLAQSLAKGRSMAIGLVCFDLTNNFLATLTDVIERIAKEHGYYLNLVLTHGSRKKELEGLNFLAEHMVDGMILFPVCYGEDYAKFIRALGIPVVSIYNKICDDIPFVGIDARQAMREGTKYLYGKGYQRIILVNANIEMKKKERVNYYTLFERQKGYEQGVLESGRQKEPTVVQGLDMAALDAALDSQPGVKTAIMCISDMYALAVMQHLKERKLRIPEDVGLMGYDNMAALDYVTPRLASISYDVQGMATQAFNTLLRMLGSSPDGDEPNAKTVEPLNFEIVGGTSL